MTLFFNLLLLEQETKCDPQYLVEALRLFYLNKSIPKNVHAKYKPLRKSLVGTSFLLNPGRLFADKTTDDIFRAQYIRLAGRRDYSLYKHFSVAYLDLSYFADIDLAAIDKNPLLTITDNKIYFKYEE